MALTKQQKSNLIEEGVKKIQTSKALVFAEYNKVLVEDFRKLRRELKKAGADLKVLKKRLLNLALKKAGVNFSAGGGPASGWDLTATKTQLGTIFSKEELPAIASLIHKFSKDLIRAKRGEFSVMAAYDFMEKRLVDANEFRAIATLPTREVLLAQVAMMLMMPIKKFMMTLNERSKKL